MKNIYNLKGKSSYAVIAALVLFSILFVAVLPLGQDLHFHIYRIGAMAEELKRTSYAFPVRILSASYNDYGYGVPLFYGDLMLYIPALLVTFGMDEVIAYKLLVVAIFLLCFWAMYSQMKRAGRDSRFALLSAVFYTFSAYFLTDLCIRSSIGEACAFLFLPFVFAAFYNLLYRPVNYDWLYLAMGMSGLLLSHNLTAVFTAVILLVWAVIKWKEVLGKHIWKSLLLAAATTIGLTASFLFPFLEAVAYQSYQTPGNSEYQMQEFTKHTLDLIDFFLPYEIKKGISALAGLQLDTDTWHPGAAGLFLTGIFILVFLSRKEKKNKSLQVSFWIAVIVYFYMFLEPLVTLSGKWISFMQFEWRLLTFCTFAFSVYAAYLLVHFFHSKWQNAYIALAIGIAVFTIGGRYAYQMYLDYKGMEYIQEINEEYADHYIMEYSPNAGDNLYLPEGVSLYLYEERGEVITSNHEDVQLKFYRSQGKLCIDVQDNPYDDTVLELPLYHYKGYEAAVEGYDKPLELSASEKQLVQVRLGELQKGQVVVAYKGTKVQQVSNWVSIVTGGLLLWYLWRKNASKKARKNQKEKEAYKWKQM